MRDSEIAATIAATMGWKEKSQHQLYCSNWECNCDTGGGPWFWTEDNKVVLYKAGKSSMIMYVNHFSPATRWDHVGIVIDWMERQGKVLNITKLTDRHRMVWFVSSNHHAWIEFEDSLTPRHICLAALETL